MSNKPIKYYKYFPDSFIFDIEVSPVKDPKDKRKYLPQPNNSTTVKPPEKTLPNSYFIFDKDKEIWSEFVDVDFILINKDGTQGERINYAFNVSNFNPYSELHGFYNPTDDTKEFLFNGTVYVGYTDEEPISELECWNYNNKKWDIKASKKYQELIEKQSIFEKENEEIFNNVINKDYVYTVLDKHTGEETEITLESCNLNIIDLLLLLDNGRKNGNKEAIYFMDKNKKVVCLGGNTVNKLVTEVNNDYYVNYTIYCIVQKIINELSYDGIKFFSTEVLWEKVRNKI